MVRPVFAVIVSSVVAALSAATHGRTIPTEQATPRDQAARNTVIWSGAEVGNVHSISPDGRMLAYIDRSQQPGVGIRDLSTGTNRIIARALVSPVGDGLRPALSESAAEVVFSGDGSQVAYSWAKHRQDVYEVRITDVREGGSTRVIATMEAGAFIRLHDWSKDGKWIAIERSSSKELEYVVVSVADGSSRVRKTIAGRGQLSRMAFSPDSRYLAYDRPANEKAVQHDVFIIPVETGSERTAATGAADESVAGWSPDGRYLLFTSEEGGSINLRGQPMTNGAPDGPAQTFQSGFDGNPVGMTAAGALVVTVASNPTTIFGATVNRETGAALSAPVRLSTRRWTSSWEPVFSRDGRRLAYLSNTSFGGGLPNARPRPFLTIASLDTGQSTVLPLKVVQISGFDWSHDGRTFVAMATDLQGRYGIHSIDPASGNITPVAIYVDGTRFTNPQWAGSGRSVYYNRTPQGDLSALTHTVLERNLDTKEERVFLDWKQVRTADGSTFGTVRNLRVSPDSQHIVALGTLPGSTGQLWVVSVKDKSARSLPLELESGQFPISNALEWMPDGRAVLINHRQGTGREAKRSLWLVPIDGSKAVRLAIELPIQDLASAVHPDGRQVAFVSGAGTREIRLLEGLLATSGR